MLVHPAYARGLAPDEGRTHNRHADSGRFPGKGRPRRRPPHTGERTTFRRGKDLHEAGDLRTAVRHRGQWHMVLALLMGRLTRMARLPEIVGLAMPTALCSNAAANSILVSSHAEGQIRTSALIAGGMMNSYLAYISHSIRVMSGTVGTSRGTASPLARPSPAPPPSRWHGRTPYRRLPYARSPCSSAWPA